MAGCATWSSASGGKVVKNVAGYDLPKLATGALGTLGVITQATFRLHPVPMPAGFPTYARSLSFTRWDASEAERLVLAVQDSKLAHIALQVRAAPGAAPEVDVLFAGTDAGVAGQEAAVRALAGMAPSSEESSVWDARQQLCDGEGAVAKISVLPASIAETLEGVERLAVGQGASWQAVLYAHGIGWVRLDGAPPGSVEVFRALRTELARRGGSLMVIRQPETDSPIDAWGDVGDALPLMRAVKQQLDPRGILNPGRFVGGI
jgi:glycolate oxidase FAD binding subunit